MTWLGALNFVVLQWFGVRLARSYVLQQRNRRAQHVSIGEHGVSFGYTCDVERVLVGYRMLRWIWPLTGWWSPYRWIARRGA